MRKQLTLIVSVAASHRYHLQGDHPAAEGMDFYVRSERPRAAGIRVLVIFRGSGLIVRPIFGDFSDVKQSRRKSQRKYLGRR